MSDGLQIALIAATASLITGIVGFFGVRFTARQSAKAQAKALALEDGRIAAGVAREKLKIESQAYERAQETLLKTIAELRNDVASLRSAQAEDKAAHRREIDELRAERREQIIALNSRVDEVEAQRDGDRKVIESLNAYVRALLRLLRDNKIPPLQPPDGMHFDTD